MYTIRHRASLVLHLMDNITGMEVSGVKVSFYNGEQRLQAEQKGRAIFVFLDLPEGTLSLTIDAYGYETVEKEMILDQTQGPQELTVFMAPDQRYIKSVPFRVVEGIHPGIEHIEAVRLQREICNYKGLDERKRILSIYGHRGKEFKEIPYAIIDEDSMTYETFKILRHIDDESIKVEVLPEKTYKTGDKINRVCQGEAYGDGRYIIKLADEGKEKYIVKYRDCTGEHFSLLDFEKSEPFQL